MTARRDMLRMLGSLGLAPWLTGAATHGASSQPSARLVAAWQSADVFRIGVLAAQTQGVMRAAQSIDVPTRAHGLLALADDNVLVVARRPGDWLLRWSPGGSKPEQWQWIESSRAFNGHVIASPDGKRLFHHRDQPGNWRRPGGRQGCTFLAQAGRVADFRH